MEKITLPKIKNNRGFVILFAVTIAAILLSIALGVSGVALREIKFGTSAKDTNEAFFAADTGAECALNYDKSDPAKNAFGGTAATMNCAGRSFSSPAPSPDNFWTLTLSGLGNGGQGCAIVTMDKTFNTDPDHIVVTSKGYNNSGCSTNSSTAVERQLEVRY